jgi:hypothetical protein
MGLIFRVMCVREEVFVCVCEKRKKRNRENGNEMRSCGELIPWGPPNFFQNAPFFAISAALWSFHANSEIFANGENFLDQFFKVVSF